MVKTLFDLFFSLIAIIVFSPLLLILAVIIRSDGGPVFYRGVRVGLNGKLFRIFKFRSMVVNADKIGGSSTSEDDPRLTKIGQFIRKYKLDELPQFINVLVGDMSIVGPRPEVPSEVATYSEEEKNILSVRPGITDYASLEYHNESEILKGAKDPHQAYREKIRPGKLKLALKYVNERSFKTDLDLIYQTFKTLVITRI